MPVRMFTAAMLVATLGPSARADDKREARLDKGEIIVETRPLAGSDLPEIVVTAVIEAPPEKVWAVIDKCGDYQRTMVHMKNTKELSREHLADGDLVRCESYVQLPWPMSDLHGVLQAKHTVVPGKWTREWHMESGDYRVNSGTWVLVPRGPGRTLLEYRQRSEPKMAVPGFIRDAATRYAMPDLMEKIRAEVK
jgi:hypothetical protein